MNSWVLAQYTSNTMMCTHTQSWNVAAAVTAAAGHIPCLWIFPIHSLILMHVLFALCRTANEWVLSPPSSPQRRSFLESHSGSSTSSIFITIYIFIIGIQHHGPVVWTTKKKKKERWMRRRSDKSTLLLPLHHQFNNDEDEVQSILFNHICRINCCWKV